MSRFGTADRLASLAGVAPVSRDSSDISGTLHRPRRFYERKRAEGKRHTQAVLPPARRRVNSHAWGGVSHVTCDIRIYMGG